MYYALLDDGRLLFGSELKSMLAHGGLKRDIDPLAVEEYFALGYVAEPRTIFKQARKLSPGHSLCVRQGEAVGEPVAYWDVRFSLDNRISQADAQAELVERLQESVRLRMIAEVPLGAFLSGGVDSSAVVALMAGVSSGPVNTCSIGFDDPAFNESAFAQMVADRYKTNHRLEIVKSDDFDLIDTLARLYDEPYADSSAIPTYRVCQLARKHVTVALSGDGGDESFGGYRRYRLHLMEERMRAALPQGVRSAVFGTLGRLYPKADWAPRVFRAKTTFEGIARGSVQAYLHSVSILRAPMRDQLFSTRFKSELAGYDAAEVFARHAAKAGTADPLALIQYLDYKTYLVGDINTKVDRASMAHSLEVREPLMDHELVEWLATLPSSFKIRGQEGKFLFKKSMEPHLPNDVLYRPKMGFWPGHGACAPKRDGTRLAALRWRLLFLSAGEASLAALMARSGYKANAGQQVRLADFDADVGVGLGAFETLNGCASPAALSLAQKDAATRHHGAAGVVWLRAIVNDRDKLADIITGSVRQFVAENTPPDAAGQVLRVAQRFGLVALAGELAMQYGVTGWVEGEATQAASRCFAVWLDFFGGAGSREDRVLLAQVRGFFETHSASRFEDLGAITDQRVINRAGFCRAGKGDAVTGICRADSASGELNGADAAPTSCGLQQQWCRDIFALPDWQRVCAGAVSIADSRRHSRCVRRLTRRRASLA